MRGALARPAAALALGVVLLLGAMPAPGGPAPGRPGPHAGSEGQSQPESSPPAFNIFGLVESPGRYDWSAGMTVGRAVSAAGGYADGGSPDELQIQRMVDGRLVSRAVTEDDPVQPDDVIMVRGRAVARPDEGGQNRSPGIQMSRSSFSRSTTCSTFGASPRSREYSTGLPFVRLTASPPRAAEREYSTGLPFVRLTASTPRTAGTAIPILDLPACRSQRHKMW